MNQFRGVVMVALLAMVPVQLNGAMAGLAAFKQHLCNALLGGGPREHDEETHDEEAMGWLDVAHPSDECEPGRSSPALTVVRQGAGGGAAGGSGASVGGEPLHPHAFPLFDEGFDGAASAGSERSRGTEEDEAALELSEECAALVAEAAETRDAVTSLESTQAAVTKMKPAFTRSTLPSRFSHEEWTMGKGTPATCRDSGLLYSTVVTSSRSIPTLKEPRVFAPLVDFARELNAARYGNIASMLRLSDYYWQLMEAEKDEKKRKEFYEKALSLNMRAFILIEIDFNLRVSRTIMSRGERLAIMKLLSLRYKKYSEKDFKEGLHSVALVRIRSNICMNLPVQLDGFCPQTRDWILDLLDHAESFSLTREQLRVLPDQWASEFWRITAYE